MLCPSLFSIRTGEVTINGVLTTVIRSTEEDTSAIAIVNKIRSIKI